MKILAIETSCDDTSVAILEDNIVLAQLTFSQLKSHQNFGGVIPEIASRLHQDKIFYLIKKVFQEAVLNFKDVEAIVFTGGPGLINTLQVGLVVAKMLAFLLKIPLYKINHLEAHLYSPFIGQNRNVIPERALALIVSGGHTILALKEATTIKILGETLDDAIGESYDKIGKILGFKYPAGPKIDEFLRFKNINLLPKGPKIELKNYNFSYSGLKTWANANKKNFSKQELLYSFQYQAVEQLVRKVNKAKIHYKINNLLIGGGVSANYYLRTRFKELADLNLFFPKIIYATDNAAMIGYTFYVLKEKLLPVNLETEVNPNWELRSKK